jgi:hypothetical protein
MIPMEKIYIIEGVKREGDEVKLVLNGENVVKEKPSLMNMIGNLDKLQQNMTYQTKRVQDPDQIRVPYEHWSKHKYNIGDTLKISIKDV